MDAPKGLPEGGGPDDHQTLVSGPPLTLKPGEWSPTNYNSFLISTPLSHPPGGGT